MYFECFVFSKGRGIKPQKFISLEEPVELVPCGQTFKVRILSVAISSKKRPRFLFALGVYGNKDTSIILYRRNLNLYLKYPSGRDWDKFEIRYHRRTWIKRWLKDHPMYRKDILEIA